MKPDDLRAAMREAERFLIIARKALKPGPLTRESHGEWFNASKETGAVKRASMDLTRALADMRRVS
jgi:hypothetical protein